jgi:monothiol glutaredoxin
MLSRSFFQIIRNFSETASTGVSECDPKAKEIIEELLQKSKVVLFMKGTPASPKCGFSRFAVNVLSHYNVKDFTHFNILEDAFIREELKKYSEWPTYPQIYINKELIGGADILKEMHLSETLKPLLEKHGIISQDS